LAMIRKASTYILLLSIVLIHQITYNVESNIDRHFLRVINID
jgi:hypothetical protein